MEVSIIATGTANLASVVTAFERIGAQVLVTRRATDVVESSLVVVPGVGTFDAGMAALRRDDLAGAVGRRVEQGRATFGICLGLQLLGRGSAESPGTTGLGLIDAEVQPLHDGAPVPQMGWNRVEGNGGLIEPGWAYFANSYAFAEVPAPWRPAFATHAGRPFVAAAQHDATVACQFHPELSGEWGLELLQRWLKEASC